MKCPHCPETHLSMSERQGIEIDYCPSCRGIWLDRGELDKLLEKARQESSPSASSQTKDQTSGPKTKIHETIYKDEFYKYKKKKSFLEELFD